MKKDKILLIVSPILFVALIVLGYFKVINNNSDAIKFKNEYESLNNKKSVSNKEYKELSIKSNNPFVYADYDKLLDIIENGTGIIYLGFPECPWCRSALPVLLDVAKKNKINTIYYKNVLKDRDSYVVQDGNVVYELDENNKEIKGTEGYHKMLKALDSFLSDYVLYLDNEKYEVGEKRIFAPSVIFVRDGKVLGIHVATVETQKSGYDKMTDEQYNELYSIYEDYILKMNSKTCSSDKSC